MILSYTCGTSLSFYSVHSCTIHYFQKLIFHDPLFFYKYVMCANLLHPCYQNTFIKWFLFQVQAYGINYIQIHAIFQILSVSPFRVVSGNLIFALPFINLKLYKMHQSVYKITNATSGTVTSHVAPTPMAEHLWYRILHSIINSTSRVPFFLYKTSLPE